MKRFLSFITLSVLIAGQVLADNNLPNQPIAADGGYVVQWDCATNDFHKNAAGEYANEMEYNETFVLAVNIEGTDLAAWIDRNPTNTGYVRGVAVDFWRVADNKQFPGSISRLWHIRDHIYAATYNMQQVDEVWHPSTGSKTQFKARIFGFESPLGDKCSTAGSAPSSYKSNPQSNWYQWRGQWVEGYCSSKTGTANNDGGQAGEFFHFAPYTGAKTSQMPNPLLNSISYYQGKQYDNYRNIYYDSGHWVNHKGYASPFCTISPCAVPEYPQDYAVSASATSVCPVTSQTANITLAGSQTGYTYELYQDGQPTGETKAGTGSPLVWSDISEAGTYTVYSTQDGSNTPVQMIPCTGTYEVTLTTANNCCRVEGATITASEEVPCPEKPLTLTATWTSGDGQNKTIEWWCNGNKLSGWTEEATADERDTKSQITVTAGSLTGGSGGSSYYTYICKIYSGNCSAEPQKQIHVEDKAECHEPECPAYTWAIDGTAGVATPMYPGGWYDISCTCEAGAPTVAITGTGVTTVNTTTNGNTTTLRIELSGSATGEMEFAASNAANSALNYKACGDTLHPTIADCDGMTAETYKIEWFNYNGATQFPQYWIANGAPVYLRDNAGKLEADVAHTDGQDEWLFIATGEQKHGEPVYYIRNGLTRRYLHRGTQHGNPNGDWEYAEALLDATLQAADDNYKWVLYPYKGDTIFACVADFSSTADIEGKNGHNGNPYVLHTRLWEAQGLFSNPSVQRPGVVCGKMAGQGGSPVFYMKHREHPQVSGVSLTTQLQWNGTAPADTVFVNNSDELTYAGLRSDDIHSINELITYESTNTGVATVDATGKVTIIGSEGEEAEIRCILEEVGCFKGDTLRYIVKVNCPEEPELASGATTILLSGKTTLTLSKATLGTGETGAWVYTAGDKNKVTLEADMKWSASVAGTYTFYYQITNTNHPECTRASNSLTITVKEKEDYPLPHQPKAADGTYVVLWDCDANDFAAANTMEWGETFVLAVNLAGTPLGNWVMQQPSQAGAVRTIAFDRWLDKGTKPENKDIPDQKQFDENACRLWLIRDTIFGATFNFSQIKLKNGSFHTPATGATTGIAARLFGVEAAHGDKCGNTPSVSQWWQWSDSEHSIYSEWNGQWQTGKYVSEDDEYLFHFAPYTGKSDAAFTAQDDDVRDRWYDSGHDFSTPGNKAPCTLDWPVDQTLSIDKQTICVDDQETATLTMGGSETGWEYSLYNNNVLVSSSTQAGTGAALTWTISAAGSYTVQATSTNGQHDDQMGSCTNNGVIAVSNGGCQTPVCPDPVNIPYPNLTYNLNADAFPIELAEASGNNVRYQWFCYTDANPTPQPYTGEGATTNACIPATNTEGKVYYYCMVYTDDCPDGVVYCNTADVTVQACQTLNGTTFTLTSTKTNYDEGEQIVLTANFNGWGGEHTYVWTLNGTPIDSTATHQIVQDFQTSTLTIPAAAASDGGTYTVTIYDGPDCHKDASRTITVKEQEPIEPDERKTELTVCAGEPITLTADSMGHNYEWNTTETTRSITVTPTQIGGTETYTVRVWDYKIKSSNNLMANGDFENYTDYHQPPTGFTSDYEYLPFDPTASGLYNTYKNKNGVYLLSCDANHTWEGYALVKPHGGKYFAMFDAAQTGFAWRVTTNDNPNMKLKQGAKYIFSYWAADLNTGNERNRPAELQFSINYKDATGQMQKEYLGNVLKLGKDNKWHYSETFWIAPCNSDYIEIGVEDQCDYAGPGNDFGLDDIIFQMVTGEMEYTVDKQKWVLTVEDCTPEECIENRIYRKWNDLLFVDNADHRYTAYQWYCDGKAIDGATGQYYYEEGKILAGDGHRYHCVVTLAAGGTETLCDMLFNEFPTSLSQGRHPAPAKVRVYSPAGKLLMTGTSDQDIIPTLNPGCYLIYSEDEDGETTTTKLLIY